MSIVDRFELATRRMNAGHHLTTGDAAALLSVSPSTLLRRMRERGFTPVDPGQGRRPASWAAADVQALLVRVEVSHAQAI